MQRLTIKQTDFKGVYSPSTNRYDDADNLYTRCGKSGVMLPKVSLGFWHNFGGIDPYERSRAFLHIDESQIRHAP
ncbi:hypothetical protein [Prevotella sp. S7-1-8]|uniref:hypothetical protein n=1 Tax=Prevotella sp. S7-1-8 TaxID=1284775 RepID=UPI000A82F81F|nr:hypothetical protein [Prevotella sp. S7-1-8]